MPEDKIESIEFQNFQGHIFSTLVLDKGLNVISGRSHAGKSSIIRGVKWILENRPLGDAFRRRSAPSDQTVSAAMSFSEDSCVSRERNSEKGVNQYTISGLDEPLKAVKTDVPDEVKSVARLGPENLQSQGDKYFLIGKSPGQVASEINRVVGLDIIDKKAAKIKSKIAKVSQNIRVIGEQIEKTRTDLLKPEFDSIDENISKVNSISNDIRRYKSDSGFISEIKVEIKNIFSAREQKKEALSVIKNEKVALSIKKKILSLSKDSNRLSNINICVSEIEESRGIKEQSKIIVDEKQNAYRLRKMLIVIDQKRSKISTIKALITDIEKAKSTKDHMLRLVQSNSLKKKELEKLLDVCPKCGANKKYWRK